MLREEKSREKEQGDKIYHVFKLCLKKIKYYHFLKYTTLSQSNNNLNINYCRMSEVRQISSVSLKLASTVLVELKKSTNFDNSTIIDIV